MASFAHADEIPVSAVDCLKAEVKTIAKSNEGLPDEFSRQFVTDRGLERSEKFFFVTKSEFPVYKNFDPQPMSLTKRLMNLKENQIWMNFGSGQGIAETEVLKIPDFKGKIVDLDIAEVSPEAKASIAENPGRFQFLDGKTVEAREADGTLKNALPEGYAVATDLFGANTYSEHLDQTLFDELNHAAPDGILATIIPTEHYEMRTFAPHDSTQIRAVSEKAKKATQMSRRVRDYVKMERPQIDARRSLFDSKKEADEDEKIEVDSRKDYIKKQFGGILGYLESIKGVKILSASFPPEEGGVVVVLQRTTDPLYVPPLKLEKYNYDWGPPLRIYSW